MPFASEVRDSRDSSFAAAGFHVCYQVLTSMERARPGRNLPRLMLLDS